MLETITTTATEDETNTALDALELNDYSELSDEDIEADADAALSACGDIKAQLVAAGLWDWVIGKVVGWIRGIWEKFYGWGKTIVDEMLARQKVFTFTPPSGSGPGGNP